MTPSGILSAVRVLLVDDFAPVRLRLAARLLEDGHTIAGEAGTAVAALALAAEVQPDVVILDLNLPDRHGLEAIPDLRRALPDARILVLTNESTPRHRDTALARGADGFFDKSAEFDDLVRALQIRKD